MKVTEDFFKAVFVITFFLLIITLLIFIWSGSDSTIFPKLIWTEIIVLVVSFIIGKGTD